MERSNLDPEIRKIYEELDTLDFKVSLAREAPGLYTSDEIGEMADDMPKRLQEVADELERRFNELPLEMRRRIREHVHHNRDMTDVWEWIEHMQDNVEWLDARAGENPVDN